MWALFSFAFRKYLQDNFPGVPGAVADLFSTVVLLSIYWFTAKAFGDSLATPLFGIDGTYFEFILIGELTLALPQILCLQVARSLKAALIEGYLDQILISPRGSMAALSILALGALPYEALKVFLTAALAISFFQFQITIEEFLFFWALQVCFFPVFLGLGLIAAAIFLRLGRGIALLGQATVALEVLAGAYFPIAVLPERAQWISQSFSPFTFLLESCRQAMVDPNAVMWSGVLAKSLLLGIFCLGLGFLALKYGIAHVRKSGSIFPPTT
jgi:ABC-type multidrug transport system permease subunit